MIESDVRGLIAGLVQCSVGPKASNSTEIYIMMLEEPRDKSFNKESESRLWLYRAPSLCASMGPNWPFGNCPCRDGMLARPSRDVYTYNIRTDPAQAV